MDWLLLVPVHRESGDDPTQDCTALCRESPAHTIKGQSQSYEVVRTGIWCHPTLLPHYRSQW